MTPDQLAQAVTAHAHAKAATDSHLPPHHRESFVIGWLEGELATALDLLAHTDTPAAQHYLTLLAARLP